MIPTCYAAAPIGFVREKPSCDTRRTRAGGALWSWKRARERSRRRGSWCLWCRGGGGVVWLSSGTIMAKSKPGTRLHGVPSDEMRDARRQMRERGALLRQLRQTRPPNERHAKPPDVSREAEFFSVHHTEAEADFAGLRLALASITEARGLKPRSGRPMNATRLRDILDELERAGIPLDAWRGSKAHRHIRRVFHGRPDDIPLDDLPHDNALSDLRKLKDLRSRVIGR